MNNSTIICILHYLFLQNVFQNCFTKFSAFFQKPKKNNAAGIYFTVKIQNPAKRRLLAIFTVEKRFAATHGRWGGVC